MTCWIENIPTLQYNWTIFGAFIGKQLDVPL